MEPHEFLGSQFFVEACRRNSGVIVVEDEGAERYSSLFTLRVTASRMGIGVERLHQNTRLL